MLVQLGIPEAKVFLQSFNRPNLIYEVRPKGGGKKCIEEMASLVHARYARQSGIVYCFSRRECEEVAQKLQVRHLNQKKRRKKKKKRKKE